MIFTFGSPDLYILPSDVPSSTHTQKENQDSGSLNTPEEEDILSIKISYCNNYIFILTKRVLFAYSNGNELLYLGRLTLSESGFSEFGNFRDLVILPVSNLFGLLVDNSKHLLVVNYQNSNFVEASSSNTPVQTPTNRGRYTNPSFNSENVLSPDNSPTHIGPTPLTTTPVAAVNVNKRFTTGNIVGAINRIFRPSDDEVEELRDSFDLYLKNFVRFRLIYDVWVPSDFSFMLVVDQQFVFWTKELSGLYSTISNDGFLNLLINDFNTFKRKVDEVKRINLYLLTTNLLNNVNIIGNIPLSYGLCYINLQSITINTSRFLTVDSDDSNTDGFASSTSGNKENKDSKDKEAEEVNQKDNNVKENDYYKNFTIYNDNDSLFQMIYKCISNIRNTDPNNLVSSSGPSTDSSNSSKDLEQLQKKNSIDADTILDMLEVQNKSVEIQRKFVGGDKYGFTGIDENLVKSVRNHFIVDNRLYLLSSNFLMYINIHSPQDYENNQSQYGFNDSKKESSINSYVTACSTEFKEDGSPQKLELGRLVYENVEDVYIDQDNEFVCVIFKGNKVRTFYLKRLDKPISELDLEEDIEDVCWSNKFLIILTVNNYFHFYSYSLQELYSTPVDPTKRGTSQKAPEGVIGTIRTFSNLSNNSLSSSDPPSTYRSGSDSVLSTNRSNQDTDRNHSRENESERESHERQPKGGRLLGINNNLKLLLYNRRLVVYNLYINHSNVSDFNLFLNSNNILIISSSCFFSPTKSFGTTFNVNLSKDKRQMFTLKLPNLNIFDREDSDSVDEEQPCSIDDLVIKDIKINKTANYILIHHASSSAAGGSGTKSTSGIILYDNNKYMYSSNSGVEVLSINWFTNHIFYLVVSINDPKQVPGKPVVERKKIPFKYYVSFYSINNMNDVLIDIPMKQKPVCTSIDTPYLFIVLDEDNKLYCYDLFYIQYKMLYSFDLNKLNWLEHVNSCQNNMNLNPSRKSKEHSIYNHGEHWKEIYVFGFKKFLLLDLYRELYLVDENNFCHLISNVNQVVLNVSVNINYQYLVTTLDGESYLLSNYPENPTSKEVSKSNIGVYGKMSSSVNTSVTTNTSNKDSKDKAEGKGDSEKEDKKDEKGNEHSKSLLNTSVSGSSSSKGKTQKPVLVMDVVKLLNSTHYILNINNDVMVLLNLNKDNISLSYTLLPTFLTNNSTGRSSFDGIVKCSKYVESNQLRGREMLLLEYLIYYFNVLGKEVSDKEYNNTLAGVESLEVSPNTSNSSALVDDTSVAATTSSSKDSNTDGVASSTSNKDKEAHEKGDEKNTENKDKQINSCKEIMERISKMMKNKLFSISCRKQNELDRVIQLEEEFNLKSEDCFNYLLEEKEFEFASLLLLPLQIKTDPYHVRTQFCKNLIRELLSSIIQSTPQTGLKSRRNNQALIIMLTKFYKRLPLDEEDVQESSLSEVTFDKCPIDKLLEVDHNNATNSSAAVDNTSVSNTDGPASSTSGKDSRDKEAHEKGDEKDNNVKEDKDKKDKQINSCKEIMDNKRISQRFGKGIDLVIDMNELIEDLLLKLNFMPVYQLNFLDYTNKEREKEDKDVGTPGNYSNFLNNDLKDIVRNIVELNKEFDRLALNIVIYFMIEANHVNYNILTTSDSKNTELFSNKFFTEENMQFYMLVGYNNYICLCDLVVNNPKMSQFMIKIQESNCRIDSDPEKKTLLALKSLLIRAITTYTLYPN